MPIFEYQAVNARGKSVKGLIDAESSKAARQKLRATGVFATELVEGSGARAKGGRPAAESPALAALKDRLARVSNQEMALMTRQLATLVGASIPLVEALTALIDQVENIKLKKTLTRVRDQVNEGSSMAEALKAHPRIFSNLFSNMVSAGESSGTLDLVLKRLADFTQNQMQLVSKVKGAMVYPLMMLVMMAGVMIFLTTYLIPKISDILKDLGMVLPWYTRIMMGISSFMQNYWWAVILAVVVFVIGVRRWFKTEKGTSWRDRKILRLPLFGNLVRKVAIARFARTLSTLLNGGVPIIASMRIVRNVVDNSVLAGALDKARESITEGSSIAGPLKASGMFPPMVIHMIGVGEKSGELEDMLNQVAEAYEFEVSTTVEAMTKILEPVMLLVLAAMVAFIMMSIIVPLMQMTQFN